MSATESLNFSADVTTKTGVTVPISIDIEYPTNQGMTVIWALNHESLLDQMKTQILHELIGRGDLSLLAELPADDSEGDGQ